MDPAHTNFAVRCAILITVCQSKIRKQMSLNKLNSSQVYLTLIWEQGGQHGRKLGSTREAVLWCNAAYHRLKYVYQYIHISVWMFADEVTCPVTLACLSVKHEALVLASSKHKQKVKGKQSPFICFVLPAQRQSLFELHVCAYFSSWFVPEISTDLLQPESTQDWTASVTDSMSITSGIRQYTDQQIDRARSKYRSPRTCWRRRASL